MLSFLLYLLPGTGLLTSAGKIAATLVESFGPIMKGFSEAVVAFVKILWEGFKDVVDNVSTIIFVGVIAAGIFFYTERKEQADCRVEITKLENQIKALRKNPVRTVPNNDRVKYPWEYIF